MLLSDHALQRRIWSAMRIAGFDSGYAIASVEGCLDALRGTNQITFAQGGKALRFRDQVLRRHKER